jgi:hypothetical protein
VGYLFRQVYNADGVGGRRGPRGGGGVMSEAEIGHLCCDVVLVCQLLRRRRGGGWAPSLAFGKGADATGGAL